MITIDNSGDTKKFAELDISGEVLKAVERMGFTEMTPVQARTIPLMMEGRDIMAIAPTGTGKTVAFGIPMLEYVNLGDKRVQEIVLCPTRELAQQIADEITELAHFIPEIKIACIYGGQPIPKQLSQLKRSPQILICTPGRLLDHMQRGNIHLDAVHTMVLDEADEMLKMGFVKDVTSIIEKTPSDRQLVMYSATTNQDVMTIAWKFQHEPEEIIVQATGDNRPDIAQFVISCEQRDKYNNFLYLLDSDEYKRVMVFCNTKDMTRRLTERLVKLGYSADCLNGDIPQIKRNQTMEAFRKNKFQILIATDVAARGLDIDDVEAVINYDLPQENEYYTHRIGRTGRAKRHGVSFSFVTFVESVRMDEILKYISAKPINLRFDENGVLSYAEDGKPFFEKI
ncbi:MAG: DEAD/DEAH box helicase [Eubacteriales bacterium]|nr:DEAD/DEAH box helicase [Eubacteriales bacterium]MDD3882532.1 DEAD/DEAH box helicase [Eubacteriales bacterium]MDD4512832.1 DEAD/DEAH box helicase [Eubacteriales bacterium]